MENLFPHTGKFVMSLKLMPKMYILTSLIVLVTSSTTNWV